MKKLLALGLACCLPNGLAAVDASTEQQASLGTVSVLVIEESAPLARGVLCTRGVEKGTPECMAVHRAVLTARLQKVSTLGERGRWM